MKIALFGGSFDPPHLAHVQVLQYLIDQKKYDQIWVLPSKTNPFKEQGVDFSTRLEMCRLAFEDLGPQVQVRGDDGDLSGYSIDLVRALRQKNPQAEFSFVVGSDLKDEISQWKDSAELKKQIEFEYLPRPPAPGSPFLDLSSTGVREALARGEEVQNLVPAQVADFIQKNLIYSQQK